MLHFLSRFGREEAGAAAAEYVLILAIVGAGIGAGALYLGGKISGALTARGDAISSCTTTPSAC